MLGRKKKEPIKLYLANFRSWFVAFYKSVWLFPVICTVILIILCSLKISGSSIGIFNEIFYGEKQDSSLIYGQPQPTRSDEYNVGSLLTIAQSRNNYEVVNDNIGNGQNSAVLGDLPYNDWSTFFKPQNLGFIILPFDNAFALKWWLPGYLLLISTYFFVLLILPGRRLIAALLASAFLLSPFFQWWYLPNTVGAVAYSLFGILIVIKILFSKKILHSILWSALLAYIAACFIFFFYPPFQIVCALVAFAFLAGYIWQHRQEITTKSLRLNVCFTIAAGLLSIGVVVLFMIQNISIVNIITNTAYPGTRVVESGQGNLPLFLSSHTSPLLQSGDRYQAIDPNTSKSELSNFIIITPFLLVLAAYLLYREPRSKSRNYALIAVSIVFVLLLAWLFIPGLSLIGKITLLDKVPPNRALIGVGFANFILIVLLIDLFRKSKVLFTNSQTLIYSLLVVIFFLLLNIYLLIEYPGYLGFKTAILLSLPFALIVFLFMKRRYSWAIAVFCGFSLLSTYNTNPLYIGADVVTNTEVSQTIRKLHDENPKKWVGDENHLENFPALNGAPSLSATYYYPQLDLWNAIDKDSTQTDIYNRYAHINFAFDRDPNTKIEPYLYKRGEDIIYVITEACDSYLEKNNVGYVMTGKPFNVGEADCATLKSTINYPNKKIYIYKLDF